DNKTPIIIDGNSENIGKTEETWDETSVTIDQKELDKKLETAKENGSLLVPLADNRENASAKLLLKNIEDLAAKNSTLTLRRGETDYIMPATALDTRALMAELGATDPALVPLTISISRPRETVDVSGSEVLAPPISFTFSASYGGKTIEVSSFERFVSRCVEISETQAKRITTAIVFEEDGTYRHVPTNVFKKGDAWFANISSLTNSKYVLIFNEKKFADTQGKWYEAAVREMADRKIIAGVDEQIFAGDRSVSRAEFAALAVRALGLPAEGRAEFSDVPAGAWYSGAVAVAAKYGIVSGVGGGLFLPEASISRQEAMSMLQRAAKLAEFTQTPPVDMSFTDMDKVSDWARSAVEFNLGNHLIVGDGGKIRPQDEITRGETACVLLRLLQKAKLIDPRTEI
ncbi:MAG: S-layer homology domain-containing protein, partial [Oscillospiraceae bacterium]